MIIGDKNTIISQNKAACLSAGEKEKKEPEDSILLKPYCISDDRRIITYPAEQIEKTKKHMEKQGFEFDDKGRTPSIIYSDGTAKLIDAETAVTKYGGKVTGSLWLIDAFTAELTPEGFLFLYEHLPCYRPVPDPSYKKLIKPPPACIDPQKFLMNLEKFMGF